MLKHGADMRLNTSLYRCSLLIVFFCVCLILSQFTAQQRCDETHKSFHTSLSNRHADSTESSSMRRLLTLIKYPIAVECLIQLVYADGVHSEVLVDVYASLLHVSVMDIRTGNGGFFSAAEVSLLR